jgi:sugar-specific transcriptional regulator TrmB
MTKSNLQQVLQGFGFDSHEIRIYETLIEYGHLQARKVSSLSKVPRVTTYQNLQKLIDKGLVKKIEQGKIDVFEAVSPSVLNSIIGLKTQETETQRFGFERMLPELLSVYAKGMKRPSISFYEGVSGFIKIYDDILNEGQNLDIIASARKVPEYQDLIQEYKKKQEKVGIQIRALVPRSNDPAKKSRAIPKTKHIKAISEDDLSLDGQLIIYGDKVAITHFSGEVSHVLIENKYIAQMFRQMFGFMWQEYKKVLVG